MSNEIRLAYELFSLYLPENAELLIQETDGRLISKYLIKITYTSKRSGRKLTRTAKHDALPSTVESLRCFLPNLVLTPAEQGKEFSRLYFLEKRARQDAFLFAGGSARGNDVRVSVKETEVDRLAYESYGGGVI